MRRITALLDDVVEERNRRARKAAAAGLVLAALALASAMRPAPKPEIVYVDRTIVQVRTEYRDRTTYVYAGVGRRPGRPATAGGTPALHVERNFAEINPPSLLERHLCLSPRSIIGMRGDTATITVSNPSPGEIGITGIRALSNRQLSGFDFDAGDCRDRVLREGERCVVNICVKRRIGETLTLLVDDDASNTPESMTVEALE